ncbi:hypothetical protein B5F76_02245 [Desulfovibrio sp. An276]|uniref:recombination-associated protein RdgC n=1 Tax=Desulfovibrio sp. An276 TaxID=1965618 RepID=UPI000B3A2158|nr:recombination-associated protein RdgC [Desulfovibrio sp. An276]OUO54679.1 hypothetical protein B5F76_02245 [Desulfovibrio sp. An276]
MGFLNASSSFTRFSIVDPVPEQLWADIPDLLKKGALLDIDELPEMEAKGWTCFDDYLDTQWVTASPHKGEYLAFTLRIDTRRIPAGVIRKHVTLALKKEKLANLAQGKTYISKERKKEIKEQVTLRLRQRFLPVPAEINVVWSIRKNEVWLASVQNKVIELFMQLFLDTFQLHLQQLTPSALAIQLMGEGQVETIDRIEATVFA